MAVSEELIVTFEAPAADAIVPSLVVTVGSAGYRSGDGDGTGRGTLSVEDLGAYKVYEIEVVGTTVNLIICGTNENGTVLQPWANGVTLNADAAGAVSLIKPATYDASISYTVIDAGLATALASDITALTIDSIAA